MLRFAPAAAGCRTNCSTAAGTAAGLTGFFGYFLGTFILANTVIGLVAQYAGWGWTFALLVAACILAIFFMGLTYKEEKRPTK